MSSSRAILVWFVILLFLESNIADPRNDVIFVGRVCSSQGSSLVSLVYSNFHHLVGINSPMNLSHFHCQTSIFPDALKANHSSWRVTCYLKWVSKNLRARDFEEWAKLAYQVLQDPIYKDRIEWELAENVLNGNKLKTLSSTRDAETSGAVSELLEISERFGWDNMDKVGWSKINFELLGTSKGGRIPRLSIEKETNITKQKNGHLKVSSEGEARRRERRERQKMRKQAVFGESKLKLKENSRGSFVNDPDADNFKKAEAVYTSQKNMDMDEAGVGDRNLSVQNGNPFPGRQSLLRKAFNLRRIVS